MSKSNEITFAAIVTITLPAEEGSTQLDLVLAPADRIEASDGSFKPLGDCTLADLRRFANSMESEAWAEHESATLSELVERNQVDITFSISDELVEGTPPEKFSLLSAIALVESAEKDVESPEVDAMSDVNADVVLQADGEPKDAEDSTSVDSEDDLLEEAEAILNADSAEELAVDDKADKGAEEPEPEVTVAKSEPVHADREAATYKEEIESDQVAIPQEVRILGKRRPLDHPTWTAVDILVNETAFRDAQAHALSSPAREVAGVLVGPQPEKQPDGRYVVHISDSIIARHTRMQGASVTYTPESWRYVNDRMAELYPEGTAVIVGWYHTHPGFGIFLSGMDQFIHRNFFTQIWHVAMVLDPLAAESGFFCWNREKDKVSAYEFPWPKWASKSW
jgi:proteasome lid subunit RPN8/RPN11